MFTLKHKLFLGLSIYGLLFLHVFILFPHLHLGGQLLQAWLRWLVLGAALLATYLLMNAKNHDRFIVIKWLFWLMIIPYPVYNIFQVRHIAELFHLAEHEHFAPGSNVNFIWTCLPVTAYSFISGYTGFSCIYSVAEKYFHSNIKRWYFGFFILILCSAASLYGLYSRLDTLHLFTDTLAIAKDLIAIFSQKQALVNYFATFTFILACYSIFLYFLNILTFINRQKKLP